MVNDLDGDHLGNQVGVKTAMLDDCIGASQGFN